MRLSYFKSADLFMYLNYFVILNYYLFDIFKFKIKLCLEDVILISPQNHQSRTSHY